MSQTFNCPNCGATLEYTGMEHTMRCTYCNTAVAVPEEHWRAAEVTQQEVELKQTQKKWLKYLWIFLAVTVGLPVCLGLVGSLLGIGGSIIGIIAPFLFPKFIH